MLAACVNDEDLLRVQTPLTILNDFPPFNRVNKKWEQIPLPAVAGVEERSARDTPTALHHTPPYTATPAS